MSFARSGNVGVKGHKEEIVIMRTAITVLLFALLSAAARGEDRASQDEDWASQDFNLSTLKTWGTKHYTYSVREPDGKTASVLGTVSLSTELTDDAVILNDNYQMTYRGETLSLQIIHTCVKDKFLSPTRIESKGEGSDEVATFVATIAEGKAMIRTQDGRESVRDLPDGTITMAAMMRLVTLVSRTPRKTSMSPTGRSSRRLTAAREQ